MGRPTHPLSSIPCMVLIYMCGNTALWCLHRVRMGSAPSSFSSLGLYLVLNPILCNAAMLCRPAAQGQPRTQCAVQRGGCRTHPRAVVGEIRGHGQVLYHHPLPCGKSGSLCSSPPAPAQTSAATAGHGESRKTRVRGTDVPPAHARVCGFRRGFVLSRPLRGRFGVGYVNLATE